MTFSPARTGSVLRRWASAEGGWGSDGRRRGLEPRHPQDTVRLAATTPVRLR
ncbi:hypothetical protein [Streptomyces sp. enrichment culture]|uniref:hypothetical protein n=1 Tax=Streptomyces sp. enrichment culture TaxID=1795815 RepID=UPI003F551949